MRGEAVAGLWDPAVGLDSDTPCEEGSVSLAVVEVRCPSNPRNLLAKLIQSGEPVIPVTSDNLLELFCRRCTQHSRAEDPSVHRVLHRYNVIGELVETQVTHTG